MDIRLLVPHAGAMCLLDRVIDANDDSLCAEVMIRKGSLFCDDNGVGAWVGIEYMAQAIAAFAGTLAHRDGAPVKIGFLLGTRQYTCYCDHFAQGLLLQVKVQHLLQVANGLSSFDCWLHTDGNLLASASITVFQPDNLDDYVS